MGSGSGRLVRLELFGQPGQEGVDLGGAVAADRGREPDLAQVLGGQWSVRLDAHVGAVVILLGHGASGAGRDHRDRSDQKHDQDREEPHHPAPPPVSGSWCTRLASTMIETASDTSSVSVIMSRSLAGILPSSSIVPWSQSSSPFQ